jgi:nucleoside-diphosphate-sugar epimerase
VGGHIVVTGASGFIGSHLCDRLLADGHTVVGIDSFEDYYPRAIKEANIVAARANPAFTLHEANLVDLATATPGGGGCDDTAGGSALADGLRGSTCVYHLAAQAGVRASWGSSFEVYTRNNVLATQRLLDACVAAEVPKVIYASSSSVYGDQEELPLREDMTPRPRSPYGVAKLAGEHLCGLYHANHGLDCVSLRFFTVYGPRQRPDMAFNKFIRAMLESREIVIFGDGTQTRDFTYVGDIVEALRLAQTAPEGAVMNLGGGHRVSLADAIATLGEVMEMQPRLVHKAVEAGDVRDTWADVKRARDWMNFQPVTSLREGLTREYEWLCSQSTVDAYANA